MTKLFFILALCMLPVLAMGKPFYVRGSVYCDTCRCGFETQKTTYIAGARVRIECKDRTSMELRYSLEGLTDENGVYTIKVEDDHQDQICQSILVSSPVSDCKTADPGRNRSEVILTRYNGAISDLHFANAMGFVKDEALPGCAELVNQLLNSDS